MNYLVTQILALNVSHISVSIFRGSDFPLVLSHHAHHVMTFLSMMNLHPGITVSFNSQCISVAYMHSSTYGTWLLLYEYIFFEIRI